ncbi:hypothetical protein M8J75_012936 [Diaphorina citri]|nr:hypothetical protein M8J75_012936 [Diaphorina citri]
MTSANYPKSIYLILTIEFCERFSFCGLRTMLSLYLRDVLKFSEKDATVLYHIFYALCYFVPIIGAILADSFYGRYRTIRVFSFVYVLGNILLCLGAVPTLALPTIKTTLLGLIFIGIGTGGIKPCVAALCGEQFCVPEQRFYLERFFSVYYFIINIGGFLGMIFIPMIRKSIPCYGGESCYALGFVVPAVLMVLALVMFVVGKPMYTIRCPKKNIILQFLKCMFYSLSKKLSSSPYQKKAHWLDYAEDEYSPRLISDMKTVLAILFVFIPLPLFWSLFDQLGSSWTFQAARTDSQIFGIHILPDQMQVISPMLSLILIPLFDNCIYPALDKIRILENPLRRMVCGGCIAGFAFISAGYVELNLQGVYPSTPFLRKPKLVLINTLPCVVSVVNDITYLDEMESGDILTYANVTQGNYTFNTIAPRDCGTIFFDKKEDCAKTFTIISQPNTDAVVIMSIQNKKLDINFYQESFLPTSGSNKPQLKIIAMNLNHKHDYRIRLTGKLKSEKSLEVSKQEHAKTFEGVPVEYGMNQIDVVLKDNLDNSSDIPVNLSLMKDNIDFELGGIYCYVLYLKENPPESTTELKGYNGFMKNATEWSKNSLNFMGNRALFPTGDRTNRKNIENGNFGGTSGNMTEVKNGNSSSITNNKNITSKFQVFSKLLILSPGRTVKLIYMVPQYVLMSIGEVMFAIAGLHFSFTQAPRSMKTVTIAAWQLSVALGNLIIICIEQLRGYVGQAGEFFLYACLIFLDMLLFYRITKRYKFVKMQLDESSSLLVPGKGKNDILFNLNS